MITTRYRIGGALLAGALLLAGCGSDEEASVDDPSVETTEETTAADETGDAENSGDDVDATSADTAAESGETVTTPREITPWTGAFVAGADELVGEFRAFDPGTYRVEVLGTEMSFTTTETLNTQPNAPGFFVLSDVSSGGPDDQDLVFMRLSSLFDPASLDDVDPGAPATAADEKARWPGNDFAGWLANLPDGVSFTEPRQTTLGGLPTLTTELSLGDITCGGGPGFCIGFATNQGWDLKSLEQGSQYRVWVVDQADEDPIAVIAGIADADDAAWFDRAEAVLATVGFGDPAPNPRQWRDAGPTDLAAFGGISIELPDQRQVVDGPSGAAVALFFPDVVGAVEFMTNPRSFDGTELPTTDAVLTDLTAVGFEIAELDPTTIGGLDARVVDVTYDSPNTLVLRRSIRDVGVDGQGWWAPSQARLWLVDHPERGVLFLGAQSYSGDAEADLAVLIPWTEAAAASIEFTAAG